MKIQQVKFVTYLVCAYAKVVMRKAFALRCPWLQVYLIIVGCSIGSRVVVAFLNPKILICLSDANASFQWFDEKYVKNAYFSLIQTVFSILHPSHTLHRATGLVTYASEAPHFCICNRDHCVIIHQLAQTNLCASATTFLNA